MELKGKNILLTGASSGIGLQLTKQLIKKGCNLALLNRRVEVTEKIIDELPENGNKVFVIKCDVSRREEVLTAFQTASKNLGRIDIAILNSGISLRSSVKDFDASSAQKIFDVNVSGMMNCIEALLPDFLKERRGMIVGVSSLADGRGFPRSGVYCASKAAATILLESLRVELRKYKVKVITVKPGFVKTPMTDKNEFKMPFLMDADKAASIILKGIEKEKRIIQFPLQTSVGAKLLKLLPNSIFDIMAERT